MDQRALVEQARGGDHDAFTILLDVRLARLDAAARLILRDPELARDAVQEALIRAWRDLPGLRDTDRLDAWLHARSNGSGEMFSIDPLSGTVEKILWSAVDLPDTRQMP